MYMNYEFVQKVAKFLLCLKHDKVFLQVIRQNYSNIKGSFLPIRTECKIAKILEWTQTAKKKKRSKNFVQPFEILTLPGSKSSLH